MMTPEHAKAALLTGVVTAVALLVPATAAEYTRPSTAFAFSDRVDLAPQLDQFCKVCIGGAFTHPVGIAR